MSYDNKHEENNKDIERRRNANKRKRKIRFMATVFSLFSLGILLFVINGPVKDIITSFFVEVEQVQYAVLEDVYETTFLVMRDEKVVSADATGQFITIHTEGERVAKNAVVGYLINEQGTSLEKKVKTPIKAPGAGVVSFHIDGYESFCNPEKWQELDAKTLTAVAQRVDKNTQGKANVEKSIYMAGEPLFKVTNNLASSFLYIETQHDLVSGFKKDDLVGLRVFDTQELLVRGTIVDIYNNEGKTKLFISVPTITQLENVRMLKGSIILKKYEGYVLPLSAIIDKNGKKGIFILYKNQAVWHEVDIKGIVKDKVCVKGLKQLEWVIQNPTYVEEGQRVLTFH